jgi:Large polyvalent protein-associated domain 1
MLNLYDWIDKGGQLTPPNQYATQNNPDLLEGLAYQAMTPEERAQQRQHYQDQATAAAAMPPAQETGTYKVGQAIQNYGGQIGGAIAAPGQAITDAANRNLGPPAGYEGSWSSTIGGAVGHLPVYLAEMWMGVGIPGMATTAAGQTFAHDYKTQIDAGVPADQAALSAGTKALIAGGAMTLPVARWVETLAPAEKATYLALATRMAGDGVVLSTVSAAQTFLNNAIDRIHNPTKDLLEGVTDPKTLVATLIAGMVPGGYKVAEKGVRDVKSGISGAAEQSQGAPYISLGEAPITFTEGGNLQPTGVAGGGPGRDTQAATGAPGTEALRAQIRDLETQRDQLPPGSEHAQAAADLTTRINDLYQQVLSAREPSTAPEPDKSKVAGAITTPPERTTFNPGEGMVTGRTPLVRLTDSRGVNWIGHQAVLVREGVNGTVDEHFQEAEKTQPVNANDNPEAIDSVLAGAHVDTTEGIRWDAKTKTGPDGVEVVTGQDASGRLVEMPADRYAVLSEYGDVGRDAYMASRPGETPLVAMRDPNTGEVIALAQGREPPQAPRDPTGQTFEARDEAGETAQTGLGLRPAVEVGGKLYVGATHGEAYDQALRENGGVDPGSTVSSRNLFVTPEGEVLTHAQAQERLAAQDLQAQARPTTTQRQPTIAVSPNITDRPSLYRQMIRDAGYDPATFVNQVPIMRQAHILARHLMTTLGFKDVRMGPKMQPQKAVDSMLDAYRNLQWMAHALGGGNPAQGGYPLKTMSLNGKLILRLEAWQPKAKDAYLGMYSYNPQTGEHTIHMPDRSNSFAHEWTHAMDHELVSRLAQVPSKTREFLLSGRTREGALGAGKVEEAFANVMRAMFHDRASEAQRVAQLKALAQGTGAAARRAAAELQRITAGEATKGIQTTRYYQGSLRTPGGRSYWARADEMLARAGEAYVAKLVREAGGTNEFITKGDAAYLDTASQRFNDLYPHGPERDAIFNALQELHAAMLSEGTLGRGPAAQRPGDYDILDPIHWQAIGSPTANPQVVSALRKPLRAATSWRQRSLERIDGILNEMGQRAGAMGPPRLMPKWVDVLSVKDAGTPHIYSNLGQIDVYRQRYDALGNKSAARVLNNVLDKLGWRVGENRFQQMPFQRLADKITNQRVNQIEGIYRKYGILTSKIDPAVERQLWDALRGRTDPNNPPPRNIIDAAGDIRAVLSDMWYEIERPDDQSKGISVGMPRDEGYLPMVYDESKITTDPEAIPTITRAMSKDFEVKQAADESFIHEAFEAVRGIAPKPIRDQMTQLAQVEELMRNETDPKALAALDQQRQALLSQLHDPVRDIWADYKARNWEWNLQDVPWGGNRRGGAMPSSDFLKRRSLSAEARDIMADAGYMVTRPSELLPYYFHQMGRKLAFARTFGNKGEVLEQAMADLHRAGVIKQDREQILKNIESSLGWLSNNEITPGHRHWIWARTLGTLTLMRHAAFSSLGEAAVIQMQTGRPSLAFRGFAESLGQLAMEINLIKGSDRQRHWAELSRILGNTTTRMQEAMLTGRTSAFSWSPGRLTSSFYRRIGLTQVTNGTKVAAQMMAHEAMKIWGQQILDGKRGALFDPHGEYRELGIPNNEHVDYARWITSLDHIPTAEEMMNTPQGQRWGEALTRFMQKTVLEPTAAEKQVGANSAVGRFIYGLQSYLTAFQRMVLNPAMDRLHRAIEYEQQRTGSKWGGRASGIAQWTTFATTAVLSGMALQLPAAIVRLEAFDHDKAQKWREDDEYWSKLLELAFQRVGFGGTADPLLQTVTHLKYDGEISSLTNGAVLSRLYKNLQHIVTYWTGGGSQDTNTAAYNNWKASYQLIMQPMAALATALLPIPYGQTGAAPFFAVTQGVLSDTAADKFATWMAGPKGKSTQEFTPEQQQQQQDDAIKYQLGYPREEKDDKKSQGGGASSALAGLVDDAAAIAGRASKPIGAAARLVGRYFRP